MAKKKFCGSKNIHHKEKMKKIIIIAYLKIKEKVKKHPKKAIFGMVLLIAYYFSLPFTLFNDPYSTIVESNDGKLIGAKIAKDGQWRFPEHDTVPEKFEKCIVAFEDQHFYYHWGFNPVSIYNAYKQNQEANRIVRGGSTLTQQVIRLHRKGKKRTYFEKFFEIILASRLEFRYSKKSILKLYASHAPFGSNVVGIEMASWKYFGLKPHQLSWAETATLAVLPNAPSLIYPGKNQIRLMQKRNRLLKKLYEDKTIDYPTYQLAIKEPLPQKAYELPKIAAHFTEKVAKEHQGERISSTIDFAIQQRVNDIVNQYYNNYKQNQVFNMAVLVVDVKTNAIVSYVGNTNTEREHQKDVDIIEAPRSTGSILKPLLYASMLDDADILPKTLVADIPTQISGYTPENFNLTYDGAVSADRALSRSLNIPSVLMLQEYSVNRFYEQLQKFKLRNINRPPSNYGLSLILGGAESNLWDLCTSYAYMSRTNEVFCSNQAQYRTNEFSKLNYLNQEKIDFGDFKKEKSILGAGAIWQTFNAMKEVNRPEVDEAWRYYDSSLEIAWKTGTSFGSRDAWAIGVTRDYVVGVWVGNATGEGRPLLTGVDCASPVMFDVFRLFPKVKWFEKPYKDLDEVEVCEKSGCLAGENCPKTTCWIPKRTKKTLNCNYHKIIHLDQTGKFRVNSSCADVNTMKTESWFILPPVMEWYYKSKNVDYKVLPPYLEDCAEANDIKYLEFIFPKANTKIILTKNFSGTIQPTAIKVAHSDPKAELFWYLDKKYLGATKNFHELPIKANEGNHIITVVDNKGREIRRKILFE